MALSEDEKRQLIDIVKLAVESKMKSKNVPELKIYSEALKEKKGAFVTFRKKNELRGCIGYIEAVKPLFQVVQEMAIAAAFNDQRFLPLKRQELKDITIEISVLSPLVKIKDIEEIKVGIHGLYIKKDHHSGLLLPQVATSYGWDRLTFLEEVCFKAGLPSNAWKDSNANVYIFSAEIFHQKW